MACSRSDTADTRVIAKGAYSTSSSLHDVNSPQPRITHANKIYLNVFIVSSVLNVTNIFITIPDC